MKKIYQAPVTEEVKIEITKHILEGSPDASINTGGTMEDGDFSRGINSFFDDDDDDY